MSEDLERRVAELEAQVDRLAHPFAVADWPGVLDEAELARFREDFEQAKYQPVRVLPPPAHFLDPEVIRALLRECVTVAKPGEVLFFTCGDPDYTPRQIQMIQERIATWLECNAPAVKVIVLPHGEMAVAESAPA